MNDQIIFYLIGGIFLFLLLVEFMRFKLRKVDFKHFFKWGMLWFGISSIFLFSEWIARGIQLIGIKLPFNFITIIGFCTIFFMLWNVYIKFEKIEEKFGKLVQKIALKDEE